MSSCKKKNKVVKETTGTAVDVDVTVTLPTQTASNIVGDRKTVWGGHTFDELKQIVNSVYEEIVHWRKNLFKLPSGAAGKNYIVEKTRLIQMWVDDQQPTCQIALKLVMIMPALLLQKPCKKSTAKQHTEYLTRRLNMWTIGNFDEMMKEGRGIQQQLKANQGTESADHIAKVFAKLMLQCKVRAALRLLEKASNLGVAELSDQTMRELANLHPEAAEPEMIMMGQGEIPYFDPVRFSNIDEGSIAKASLRTRGAAGASGMDADSWRRILVSKNYGKTGKDLRTAIAKMAQKLCKDELPTNTDSIEAYTANRLIPLEKAPSGIRPIGIGEVLRRIVGKAIVTEIKPEILESAGNLQLCAGQKGGCEAAAHAMREIFEEEDTDAVLFVDASNAFNSINRKTLLHNIKYLCPQMATYVRNCYGHPSRLFVAGGKELLSAEGTTQGDPLAMPAYGVSILPLLILIKGAENDVKHVAYADDIGGGAKLRSLKNWWDRIGEFGPKIGYFPKACKSWLVVKEDKLQEAEEIFAGTEIKITAEGRRYSCGFVGTEAGAHKYVGELLEEWLEELKNLTTIARTEPQAAYAAFTSGFKHKIT